METMHQIDNDGKITTVAKLRDQFAMAALQGLLASCTDQASDWPAPSRAAEVAYQMADAMMQVREEI